MQMKLRLGGGRDPRFPWTPRGGRPSLGPAERGKPFHPRGDAPAMRARVERILRWFVGLSLVLGGIALLGGAMGLLQAPSPAGAGSEILVALAVLAFVFLAVLERSDVWPIRWPWFVPAAFAILLLMLGVAWAHVSLDEGHVFLSGFAPFVAFVTGLALLAKRPWAWPAAFASVTGFGPTLLLFAPLGLGTDDAALVLFMVDAVFLLALAPSAFEPSSL